MNREFIIAILSLLVGITFTAAYFLNMIDTNDWFTDQFIIECNRMYGNESWTVTQVNGKYTCIGNNSEIIDYPMTPIDVRGGWQP